MATSLDRPSGRAAVLALMTLLLAMAVWCFYFQSTGSRAEDLCYERLQGAAAGSFSWSRLGVRCVYGLPDIFATVRTGWFYVIPVVAICWLITFVALVISVGACIAAYPSTESLARLLMPIGAGILVGHALREALPKQKEPVQ